MENTRHTLLAITGLSPQVVTETLYGIHEQCLPWPNELIILTTQQGAEQAQLGLCHPNIHLEHSMLDQCCIDLKHPLITDIKIEIIPDHAGHPIDDARTREDQEALADYIVKRVAQLCADPQRILHASLAGGRKTMTFFLGYAMSLFARPDDRLSHVLIAPVEYEGLRDFYYPTPYTNPIIGRNSNQRLDTHEDKVQVMLADIPFIRQRDQLEKSVLARFCNPEEQLTYRQLVQLQQLASYPDAENETYLNFDLAKRTVSVLYKDEHIVTIRMDKKPLELAYYAMIARHNSVTSEKRYNREKAIHQDHWSTYRSAYLQELWSVVYPEQEPYSGADIFKDWLKLCESEINHSPNGANIEKTLNGLDTPTLNFFDDRKTALGKHLKTFLPIELASLIEPAQVFCYQQESDKKTVQSQIRCCNTSQQKNTNAKKKNYLSKQLGLRVSSNLCPKD